MLFGYRVPVTISDRPLETQRDIVHAIPRMRTRLPRTQPELFTLLGHLTIERGLDGLLDLVDFTGVTPADTYRAVYGRPPDHVETAIAAPDYDPRSYFKQALLSQEFRQRLLPNFLTAFPQQGRDVFIHVPKCAGTDLILSLSNRHLPLPKMLEIDGWVSDDEFLYAVAGLARAVPFHDRIFVHGHMELGHYIASAGLRSGDRIFTTIRDPLDLMLSQANYAVGRLCQDPTGRDADTAELLRWLDIPRLPNDVSLRELKDLATRVLLDPRIAQPNRACSYLGRNMLGTYRVAMENIVVHNVEITTTRHYERWLAERWDIGESQRRNRSRTILTRNEGRLLYADVLTSAMAEDQKLYDVVTWSLAQTGAASVTGMEIARLAGPWLLEGLPETIGVGGFDLSSPGAGTLDKPSLIAAEEPEAVSLYLLPGIPATPEGPRLELVASIDCGLDGAGRDHLLDGWSAAEKTFTWTNAESSQLRLLPVPPDDRCIVRLIGNPYVVKGLIPFQRIEILVNGELMGTARVNDIAVIECEVPMRLRQRDEPIILTLRLPTAARPCDVTGINDSRLLAFALRRVMVLVVR